LLCDRQPPVEKGDIRYLTLDTADSDPENHHLGFQVLVVRTEHRQLYLPKFAVALRIISDPIYYPLHGTNQRDFTSFDKARIMYQYYDLNKKAYEIITNTPEIRSDKIKNIKEIIEKNCYHIKTNEVTQGVINNLFLENILLTKI